MIVVPRWDGTMVSADKYKLATHLVNARQTKSLWEVVDEVVKAFKKSQPQNYKSYVINLRGIKEAQKITQVGHSRFRGVSYDKEHGAYLSMQVDFPVWIMMCLRKLYTSDELPLSGKEGKQFFRKFGKRFPEFLVHEKV